VDGVQSGTLTFSGGANGDITVSVSGTGEELVVVLVPQLSVNTGPSQTFGAIDEGTTSPPFTWTIRNIGTGTLTWSATTSNPQFLFGTSETANGTLAEGASDSVAVFFTAPGPGAFSGQMIFSNDSVGSTQSDISVPVAGAGIALKGSSCSTASGGAAGSRAGDVLLVGLVLAGLVHRRRREAAVARCRE
jgi:MYXO-CTERM domain-containing protein